MKNQFFSYWTAIFFAVFTTQIKFNHYVYAGESSPKILAEKIPPLKKVGRAIFGPRVGEIKTPHVDDLAKNPAPSASARRYPCCKPTCVKPRVIPVERIVYKEVIKEVEISVYKSVPKEVFVDIPVYVSKPREIPVDVPVYVAKTREIRVDVPVHVSVPRPVYVPQPVIHQPECPPGTYPVLMNEVVQTVSQPITHRVIHQEPVIRHRVIRSAPVNFQGPCNDRFVGGHHPGFINNGFFGGPQQFGGDNYGRAMAWGHHVVNNAYNIGYGIGTNAYDIGRSW